MSGHVSGAHKNQQIRLSYEEFQSLRRDVNELARRMDAMEAMQSQRGVSDAPRHEAPHAKMFLRSALSSKGRLAAVHAAAGDADATFFQMPANAGAVSSSRRTSQYIVEDPGPRRRQDEGPDTDAHAIGREGELLSVYLSDTVYLWAFGDKRDPADDDVNVTDMAIGWITLALQMVTYLALIFFAENNEDAEYSITSITLAMFLMVAISAGDMRAGYSLLFFGKTSTGHFFGALLLTNAVFLIWASLRVLFMSAENNAELVIGATTVLFIEDVDNKLMSFLSNIRQRWRLFCLLESVGISFLLALAGILYVGNPLVVSRLEEEVSANLDGILRPYFVWVFTPGALTMLALVVNFLVKKIAGGDSPVIAVLLSNARQHLWTVFAGVICATVGSVLSFELTWLVFLDFHDDIAFVLTLVVIVLVCFSLAILRVFWSWCETVDRRPLWYPMFIGWGIGTAIGTLALFSLWISWYIALVFGICIFPVGMSLFAEDDILGLAIQIRLQGSLKCLRRVDGFVHWSVAFAVHFLTVWWVTEVAIYVRYGAF